MAFLIEDDRGEGVRLPHPPRRIVSLVPSDTYTLLRLGVGDRLVGRTRYCVEPASLVAAVPEVGGTKNPDLDRILDLQPDLVVMNQEENSRADVVRLQERGVKVFATFPKRLAAGLSQVARLLRLLADSDDDARSLVKSAYETFRTIESRRASAPAVRTFIPIWNRPLMTVSHDTFISDVLAHVGASNVFADRTRRYPLAADLGSAPPLTGQRVEGRDTRYPRITLEEVVQRAPELVLLPDEPHAFSLEEAAVFRELAIPAAESGRVHLCAGKHLMWPGLMSIEGLPHLAALVQASN